MEKSTKGSWILVEKEQKMNKDHKGFAQLIIQMVFKHMKCLLILITNEIPVKFQEYHFIHQIFQNKKCDNLRVDKGTEK